MAQNGVWVTVHSSRAQYTLGDSIKQEEIFMTVAQLREFLKDAPDDYEVNLCTYDCIEVVGFAYVDDATKMVGLAPKLPLEEGDICQSNSGSPIATP